MKTALIIGASRGIGREYVRQLVESDWKVHATARGDKDLDELRMAGVQAVKLDVETERIALRAARAVGAELAGVDLLPDLDRGMLVVVEVNAVPGWRALAAATGTDVAAAVLNHLREARR